MPRTTNSYLHFGSRTDIGCQRTRNEDSLIVNPPLFVVADGMGGHNAGDVASEVAVNTLSALAPSVPDVDLLGRAVESANHAVITASLKSGREGMGTTMTACIVEGEKLAIAQVGDSRAYLLHAGRLQQITRDHSWVADMVEQGQLTPEEARFHPNRSVITRALGSDPNMQPDLYEVTASEGDRLLLCSDGLTSMVDDGSIQAMLARIRDSQKCASALVNEAIANGGSDNITVIVVDITGGRERAEKKERRRTRAWMAVVIIALAGIIGGAGFAVSNWINTSAYLAEQDGKVVIYQGIPDTIPGFKTHWVVRQTDVEVKSLQPSAQAHIQEGLVVENLEEAQRLVDEYKRQAQEDESLKASTAPASTTSTTSTTSSASASTAPDSTTTQNGGKR